MQDTMTRAGYALDQAWHAEREQLDSLTALYDADTIRLCEQLGLAAGWRCLDVGAGTGTVAGLLADRVGAAGAVVAVDIDTRFLDRLDRPNVEVWQLDVTTERLPKADFDLVHTRLVLEHLPEREAVLRSLAGAVRPGGWLLVEDFDWVTATMVEPYSDLHHRVTDAVVGFLRSRGYDSEYGRKLPGLLRGAGLTEIATSARTVQVHADPQRGVPQWELLVDQLAPALLMRDLVTADDLDAFHELCHDGVHDCFAPLMVSTWGRTDPSASPRG